MALNWKAHTELPLFDAPETLLLAYPASDDPHDVNFLAGIYIARPGGELLSESDGEAPDLPFFWVLENELLASLPGGEVR